MFRKIDRIVAIFIVLMITLGLTPYSTFAAGEAPLPPDTIVMSDGKTYTPAQVAALIGSQASTSVAPSQGTGKLSADTSSFMPAGAPEIAPPADAPIPGSVIGADGRVRITGTTLYPYRAITYLLIKWKNGSYSACSGWYYGPRTVGTAGHCVYNKAAGGYAAAIWVYPGKNGSYSPYGYTTAYRVGTVYGWTSSSSPNYDYGMIQTRTALGSRVGWFGYWWQSSNSFPGVFRVTGYPGDKPSYTMWTMSGWNYKYTTYRLWYVIDTFGGQSGSPYYQTRNSVCCYAAGYHTYGTPLSPYPGYNSATRITQAAFNNMAYWKALPYP